jgi:hypothetical protein
MIERPSFESNTFRLRRSMKYVNREMKIDQIVDYFNRNKINLIAPFQRPSVWKLPMRQRLIQNMVSERPIPAIFLYKQASGAQFDYNILDGKQRLESLILFVGNHSDDLKVDTVEHYFYGKPAREDLNFSISIDGVDTPFKDLDDNLARRFKDYPISTIEIEWEDEEAYMDEIVKLFIDINQEGVKVGRFDVVKAFGKDPMFKQVFGLVGTQEVKKKSLYLKRKAGSFSYVLGKLNIISRLSDESQQVNRMWERMTEISLFSRTPHQHRAPAEILKAFINPARKPNKRLNKAELNKLRAAFGFLEQTYRHNSELLGTKLVTDQPQFYTLITTLLSTDLIDRYPDLDKRIVATARILDGTDTPPKAIKRAVAEYKLAATKQTTHPSRRDIRQKMFCKIIGAVEV